jgi:hypothetical protein
LISFQKRVDQQSDGGQATAPAEALSGIFAHARLSAGTLESKDGHSTVPTSKAMAVTEQCGSNATAAVKPSSLAQTAVDVPSAADFTADPYQRDAIRKASVSRAQVTICSAYPQGPSPVW